MVHPPTPSFVLGIRMDDDNAWRSAADEVEAAYLTKKQVEADAAAEEAKKVEADAVAEAAKKVEAEAVAEKAKKVEAEKPKKVEAEASKMVEAEAVAEEAKKVEAEVEAEKVEAVFFLSLFLSFLSVFSTPPPLVHPPTPPLLKS